MIVCHLITMAKAQFTELPEGNGALTVTPNPPPTLTAAQDGPNPSLALMATTTLAGAPALTFNAKADQNSAWLNVSYGGKPCAGIATPASLTVVANIAGRPANTPSLPAYTGTINFSSPSGEFAQFGVTVTLVIAPSYTLTVIKAGTGSGVVTANPAGLLYAAGTPVTLTAMADSESFFDGWRLASGISCPGLGACSFKVDADDIVTATFNLNPTLTVTTPGTGSGTVTQASPPSAPGVSCGTNCWSYPPGTMVTLTASNNPGSTFTGWSGGGCSGTGDCVLTVTSNLSVTATFSLVSSGQQYTLTTATASGTGSGTISAPPPTGTPCGAGCWITRPAGGHLESEPCRGLIHQLVSWRMLRKYLCGTDELERLRHRHVQPGLCLHGHIPNCGHHEHNPPWLCIAIRFPGRGTQAATLVTSTPVETPGSFSGSLTLASSTVTATAAALTCTTNGVTTTIPGATTTSPVQGGTENFSGTSDGHVISISPAIQSIFCTEAATCSVSGTVSVLGENVFVTVNVTTSYPSAVSVITGTEVLQLTKQ